MGQFDPKRKFRRDCRRLVPKHCAHTQIEDWDPTRSAHKVSRFGRFGLAHGLWPISTGAHKRQLHLRDDAQDIRLYAP